ASRCGFKAVLPAIPAPLTLRKPDPSPLKIPVKVLLPPTVWSVVRSTKFLVALPVPPLATATTPVTVPAVTAFVAFATGPFILLPSTEPICALLTHDTQALD